MPFSREALDVRLKSEVSRGGKRNRREISCVKVVIPY